MKIENLHLNLTEYRNKVYGCWLGKNIGGTLGAPFEGQRFTNDCTFYTQDLKGDPLPNDDLDLQLIWLAMAERHGLLNLNSRLFGDYWASHIIGPWNEYSVAHHNVRNGFYPPISGALNNDYWKFSNGAWIRSEIWACLFPGNPDQAIRYAYLDSSCDHCGEGIYAEMYTAALESAAFVVKDLRKLIAIGLSKVPQDSRVAKYVRMVCDAYDNGEDWLTARNRVVEDNNKDLKWFQAPANVAYATLGLLYGEGDFGKTICRAVNCGDDTDCTGATAGAVMGIMYGRKGIPAKWMEPIGEKILTCAINRFGLMTMPPTSIRELTNRTVRLACEATRNDPEFTPLTDEPTQIPQGIEEPLSDTTQAQAIWARNPFQMDYYLTNVAVRVIYENPQVEPGKPTKVRIEVRNPLISEGDYHLRWILPEGWSVDKPEGRTCSKNYLYGWQEFVLTPGAFQEAVTYVTLDVRLHDRYFPNYISIPFQLKDSVEYPKGFEEVDCEEFEEQAFRLRRVLSQLDKNSPA